jgi:hypothetical protein
MKKSCTSNTRCLNNYWFSFAAFMQMEWVHYLLGLLSSGQIQRDNQIPNASVLEGPGLFFTYFMLQ